MNTGGFAKWRLIHRAASVVVTGVGLLHAALTAFFYSSWSPEAVWFLGTGLGLAAVGAVNLAHIGAEPCRQPSAAVVRWINYVFALLGIAAVVAVPEPQALVLLAAMLLQAVAGHWTLFGAGEPSG